MSEASTSNKAQEELTAADKKEQRLAKLKNLHLKRNEARKQNHAEVVAEDKRSKLPSNWEVRQKRLEWEEADEAFKTECAEQGLDSSRLRSMDTSADLADKLQRKRDRKKNPDEGFADFEQASYRKYLRLTRQAKPDMNAYEKEKEQLGDLMYPTKNTLGLTQRKDSPAAVERMVADLSGQVVRRSKYSRRRAFNEDADVDYINERNKKYNEKLERAYGRYTEETKQNLERGTAV